MMMQARFAIHTPYLPGWTIRASGPEHAWLKETGRAEYVGVTDEEALEAFHQLTLLEGIMPALESSHALAYGFKLAAGMRPDQKVLINLSGRGDKDIQTVADIVGLSL